MRRPLFEITDSDWDAFESKFKVSRSTVVEVRNCFRHVCKIYVNQDDLQLWNEVLSNKDDEREVSYYTCMPYNNENRWSKVQHVNG